MRRSNSSVKLGWRQKRVAIPAALALSALLFVGANAIAALTANVNVETSYSGNSANINVNPSQLIPAECTSNGLSSVSKVVVIGGSSTVDNSGDLILGGSSNGEIDGGTGSDCIIAGDSTKVDGKGGADVCIVSRTLYDADPSQFTCANVIPE
jgi:hypothetical protein